MRILRLIIIFLLFTSVCWGGVDYSGDTADELHPATESNFDITGAISLACWVRLDAKTETMAFLSKGQGGNTDFAYDIKWHLVQDNIRMSLRSAGGQTNIDSTANPAVGVWFHMLGTWDDSDDNGFIYYNGSQDGTGSRAGPLQNNARTFHIGNSENESSALEAQMYGSLTDCAVWNVRLTASEALLLASSRVKRMPLQIRPANLVAYWPLDDVKEGVTVNGETFNDLSGNRNTATGTDADGNTVGFPEVILTYP